MREGCSVPGVEWGQPWQQGQHMGWGHSSSTASAQQSRTILPGPGVLHLGTLAMILMRFSHE